MPGRGLLSRLRRPMGLLLVLAYALASHAAMTRAGGSALALALVLGPCAGAALASLWAAGRRALAALGALLCLPLAAWALSGGGVPARWLYLAQHAGIHLGLGLWFARSLRTGRAPVISALAERVHGGLVPAMAAYTRRLTGVWAIYFLGMALASLLLFALGRFGAWSLLANVVTPLAAAALFVGEYLLRYRLHPEFERVSMAGAVQAWRSRS